MAKWLCPLGRLEPGALNKLTVQLEVVKLLRGWSLTPLRINELMNLWLEKHAGVEPVFAELKTCNLGILFMKINTQLQIPS